MVRKTDGKEIVASIISGSSEILAKVMATIIPELTQSVTDKINNNKFKKPTKTNEFESNERNTRQVST